MDPALPPGGLDIIFQQYDAIRSHGATAPDTPPWEPEDEQPRDDLPDKSTPEAPPLRANERMEVANRRPPIEVTGTLTRLRIPTQRAPLTPNPNFIGGADVNGDIVSLSAPRPTYISDDGVVTLDGPGPPQKVLTDATSDRPKGKPRSWQHDRVEQMQEELGRRKMLTDLSRTSRGNFTRDEYGMQKAYEDLPNTGTYYDPKTRTLYIRGSVTARDWEDDFRRVPAWGDSRQIEMYRNASVAYDRLISEGKPVDRVVGHSLGGSVALQLAKDKDIPLSRTFGAPVLDLFPKVMWQDAPERYRHPLDPISVLDRNATWGPLKGYPHMYGGFKETFDEPAPYLLDTGTKAGLTSFTV